MSLSSCLPRSNVTLQRRAKRLAARLGRPHPRALDDRAATVLAELLEAADGDLDGFAESDCLDAGFDE